MLVSGRFKVLVDDNYNYMDESARYEAGTYESLEEAVNKCKELTIESLKDFHEEGIDADTLKAQWSLFGDDPFVFGGEGSVPFSARAFISTELCQEIIDAIEAEAGKSDNA